MKNSLLKLPALMVVIGIGMCIAGAVFSEATSPIPPLLDEVGKMLNSESFGKTSLFHLGGSVIIIAMLSFGFCATNHALVRKIGIGFMVAAILLTTTAALFPSLASWMTIGGVIFGDQVLRYLVGGVMAVGLAAALIVFRLKQAWWTLVVLGFAGALTVHYVLAGGIGNYVDVDIIGLVSVEVIIVVIAALVLAALLPKTMKDSHCESR